MIPGYKTTPELSELLREASNAVANHADESWLPWAQILVPSLATRIAEAKLAAEAKRVAQAGRIARDNEKARLFAQGTITFAEYIAQSDGEDVAIGGTDDSPFDSGVIQGGNSTGIRVTADSSSSTAVETKSKGKGREAKKGSKLKVDAEVKQEKGKSTKTPPKGAKLVRRFSRRI